jgi:large subunit ribosomal protein L29
MMKNSEIKEMPDVELAAKVEELQKGIYEMKCQGRTGELTNSAAIKHFRRDVARIKTEQKVCSAKS